MSWTAPVRKSPQVAQKGSIDEQSSARVPASLVTGFRGGRAMRYSERRGEPTPPSHISKRLVVESYNAGLATGTPYIIASATTPSGGVAYLGPSFRSTTAHSYNKMWPRSDWTKGLLIVTYDDSTTSSGSAGQYTWAKSRAADHPRKIYLEAPLPVAPQAGDYFSIGAKPFWIVFGDNFAYPMDGFITLADAELSANILEGSPTFRVEIYRAAEELYRVTRPGFPFKTATTNVDINQASLQERGLQYINDGLSGLTSHARRNAVGLACLVDAGVDFKVMTMSYVVNRERFGEYEVPR